MAHRWIAFRDGGCDEDLAISSSWFWEPLAPRGAKRSRAGGERWGVMRRVKGTGPAGVFIIFWTEHPCWGWGGGARREFAVFGCRKLLAKGGPSPPKGGPSPPKGGSLPSLRRSGSSPGR